MSDSDDVYGENPFDLLGLDPRSSPRELTDVLRRRAERVGPAQRAELQRMWRSLTLKESARVRLALLAHPRTRSEGVPDVDELRRALPPFLSRHRPAPLVPTLKDILVEPPYARDEEEAPIAPPARFESTGKDG